MGFLPNNIFLRWLITPTLLACFLMPVTCAHAEKKNQTKSVSKKTGKTNSKKVKAQPDPFDTSNHLKAIYKKQAKRMKTIDKFKKKGWIGESDSGLLKYKDPKASGKTKELLEKVVSAENKDREDIIKFIEAGVRDTKENKIFIRRRLFELYREMDATGTFYYQADNWHQK